MIKEQSDSKQDPSKKIEYVTEAMIDARVAANAHPEHYKVFVVAHYGNIVERHTLVEEYKTLEDASKHVSSLVKGDMLGYGWILVESGKSSIVEQLIRTRDIDSFGIIKVPAKPITKAPIKEGKEEGKENAN